MKWPIVHSTGYGWMMLAGIMVSIVFWSRLARRDERLVLIYISALVSAFLGAKLVYFASEGWLYWHDPNRWVILATGKSITGAFLGGFAGVIIAKRLLGYTTATGDWFAVIVPIGVMLGRIGCYLNGCCLGRVCQPSWYTIADVHGVQRWPAVPVEFLFNAIMLAVILLLRWGRIAPGQLFHIYLIAYGLFRFFHEFLRDTPAIVGPLSGYQFAALAVAAVGVIGYIQRKNEFESRNTSVGEPAGGHGANRR